MSSNYPKSFEAAIDAADWPAIAESLRGHWPAICSAARAYLEYFPTRSAVVDRLVIHIRPDGGDLFFNVWSPLPRHYTSEIGHVGIPYVEAQYFALPRETDAAFEQAHDELMQQTRSAIRAACSPELSPLPVTVMDYDDAETEVALADIGDAKPSKVE